MAPTIGNQDSGEEQDRNAGKIGGKIENNGLKSENVGGKIEKDRSKSTTIGGKMEKNGSKSETIGGKHETNWSKRERVRGKLEKNGPVRWASMALCWGGRCLLNKYVFFRNILHGNFENAYTYIYNFAENAQVYGKQSFPYKVISLHNITLNPIYICPHIYGIIIFVVLHCGNKKVAANYSARLWHSQADGKVTNLMFCFWEEFIRGS